MCAFETGTGEELRERQRAEAKYQCGFKIVSLPLGHFGHYSIYVTLIVTNTNINANTNTNTNTNDNTNAVSKCVSTTWSLWSLLHLVTIVCNPNRNQKLHL